MSPILFPQMEGRSFFYLLFLVVLTITNDVAGSSCPDGFVEIEGTCYYFSEERKDSLEAELDCSNRGGTLASFEDCETKENVLNKQTGEPGCTYWTDPFTKCVDSRSPPKELNKFICAWPGENPCEEDCGGRCISFVEDCSGNFEWLDNRIECQCLATIHKCCAPVKSHSCENTCGGKCVAVNIIGNVPIVICDGEEREWVDCPCPHGEKCCVPFSLP
ncbi:Hypp4580 [Branchiostoma lanceolatum]|uniref:Hypp4580 protein n=1 Tax=Branchiostoma lanceolatum TaxID=7740 RepID=A0A8K0A8B1_BRALA|nr:Hypp4580 [Branchiostoma lanceolatum]